MKKTNLYINSILIVDDRADSLAIYSTLLKKLTKAHVMCTKFPSEAIKWANNHFFDIILIDATISQPATQFGGLEVYKSLRSRYGASSLIVYSQFVTDDLLRQIDSELNFIEKQTDPKKFIADALKVMISLRKRQSCFVAMPFSTKYNVIFNVIKKSVQDSFFQCIRIDRKEFNQSIIDEIFSGIKNAKLIIFLANDQNPNAFYECGYSVALNKEVITLTDKHESLPFDIRDRNAISYGEDFQKLRILLNKKLKKLTSISP